MEDKLYVATAVIQVKLTAESHDEAVEKLSQPTEWEDWDIDSANIREV